MRRHGPRGEYYHELQDGSEWCEGCSKKFHEIAEDAHDERDTIRRVAFGPDGSWIILFEAGTSARSWKPS